ncbi:MAG: hypothetical protein U9N36_08540 [Euryarchaeota archaeon]|nr:hypothetical protein [Euryarchaeota archaeon]
MGTTETAITRWQALATDFRKHQKHIIIHWNRHHTALSYETTAPDGGRLELKTPQERESPLFSLRRIPPDDTSDSGGGIRKRTRTLR